MILDELFEAKKWPPTNDGALNDLRAGLPYLSVDDPYEIWEFLKDIVKEYKNTTPVAREIRAYMRVGSVDDRAEMWEVINDIANNPAATGVYEAIPSHIKPSDIPPAMRNRRLTMRDIEAERPKGPYRFRVTPGVPGESPKDFITLNTAQEYARAVKGRVQPLEEQATDPDTIRGMQNLSNLEKNMRNEIPVIIDVGTAKFKVAAAKDKQWLIKFAMGYIRTGQSNRLYKIMGNETGFEKVMDEFAKAHAKDPEPDLNQEKDSDDIFGPSQAVGPKSARAQDESINQKKKSNHLAEESNQPARTRRLLDRIRVQYPQAQSDLEAMAYAFKDNEKRDREDIEKLEKETDGLEKTVKDELRQRVSTLGQTRGRTADALKSVQSTNDKQQDIINKIIQIDKQQQQALDDLQTTVKTGAPIGSSRTVGVTVPQQTQEPSAASQQLPASTFGQMAQQLSKSRGTDAAALSAQSKADQEIKTLGTSDQDIATRTGVPTVQPELDLDATTLAGRSSKEQAANEPFQRVAEKLEGSIKVRGLGETYRGVRVKRDQQERIVT